MFDVRCTDCTALDWNGRLARGVLSLLYILSPREDCFAKCVFFPSLEAKNVEIKKLMALRHSYICHDRRSRIFHRQSAGRAKTRQSNDGLILRVIIIHRKR